MKTMVDGVNVPEEERENFENLMAVEQKVTGKCEEPKIGYTPNGEVACIPEKVKSNKTREIVEGSIKDKKQKYHNKPGAHKGGKRR